MYIAIENNKVINITQEELPGSIYREDGIDIQIGDDVTYINGEVVGFGRPGPPLTPEEQAQIEYEINSAEVNSKRGFLLQESDWIVIRAVDTNTDIPTEWQEYRQALRDITIHPNYPNLLDSDWPVKPTNI